MQERGPFHIEEKHFVMKVPHPKAHIPLIRDLVDLIPDLRAQDQDLVLMNEI